MKFSQFLFTTFFLLSSFLGYSQWSELTSIPQRSIKVLSFVDDNLGYAMMTSEINNITTLEKTIDGGQSWVSIVLPVEDVDFQDIHFYEEGKGVLLFRNTADDMVPTRLFQTIDDGANWKDISPSTTAVGVGAGKCKFLNESIGFFATDKTLYSTNDGGNQWSTIEIDNYILAIDFLDEDHGIIGTWDGTFGYKGGMLTTTDGGENWIETTLDENYTSIGKVQWLSPSLSFAAPIHGWSSILASHFYKSTDGGNNWSVVGIPTPFENATLRQVHFIDEMNGVICVGNTVTINIYHTANGGETWNKAGSFVSSYDTELQIIDSVGYIGGPQGLLYKSVSLSSTNDVGSKQDIKLFPNPILAGETIQWYSLESFSKVFITNSIGETIVYQDLKQNKILMPQTSSGIYFIHLSNDKNQVVKKVYIE